MSSSKHRTLESVYDPELTDGLLSAAPEDVKIEPAQAAAQPIVLVLALMLVAFNLRPALSSLAPVLPEVMRDTSISPGVASLLTMSPVLCLGLFGVAAPRLGGRYGIGRTIAGALLVLAAGLALRSVPAFPSLLMGTLTAGAAIGVAGVLLPSLVKRDFPQHASLMTGIYTMALSAGAAAAAGLTMPLAQWFGSWPAALAFWSLPALLAALLWLPQARSKQDRVAGPSRHRVKGLWRDPVAWQVTLFMGLQSSLAFIVFGWLAPILRDRGLDPVTAGYAVSVTLMVQLSSALTAPIIAARRPNQSGIAAVAVAFTVVGLLGSLYAPIGTLWLWIVILGLGLGASFAISLSLLVLRSPNAQVTAQLSGMAQSLGYTFASMGPLLVGLLHDWSGGWGMTGGLSVVIGIMAVVCGIGAGRSRYVRVQTSTLLQQR